MTGFRISLIKTHFLIERSTPYPQLFKSVIVGAVEMVDNSKSPLCIRDLGCGQHGGENGHLPTEDLCVDHVPIFSPEI